MDRYRELDPGFSETELEAWLGELYVNMQTAWTAKDFSPIRPYFSDTLYQQFKRQLDEYVRLGRTNYVDIKQICYVELRGYFQSGNEDHIIAEVMTRIVDYTEEDKTRELVSGERTLVKRMTYEYDLSRTKGRRTAPTLWTSSKLRIPASS